MRVLTWNLFHGRSVPPAGRNLLGEFTERIAGWGWDVALLQEVPPWWPPALGKACDAHARTALTSRNLGLCLRRPLAERVPDLIKSNGGGANAILVRGAEVVEHRRAVLRLRPERRVVHAVRLADGSWWGNLHAQVHTEDGALADAARAASALGGWAGGAPTVLGGDYNVRAPRAGSLTLLGGHGVDHVLGRGWTPQGRAQVLPHEPYSDHAPVLVELRRGDDTLRG